MTDRTDIELVALHRRLQRRLVRVRYKYSTEEYEKEYRNKGQQALTKISLKLIMGVSDDDIGYYR